MNYKLNVHDLIKCLTAPLTDVNYRWLNLCTQSSMYENSAFQAHSTCQSHYQAYYIFKNDLMHLL